MCDALIGLLGTLFGIVITTVLTWVISKRERVNQFRLAALEKRLAVHQEAYALWSELFIHLFDDNIGDYVMKAQEWWYKNCLYLDPKSRNAFRIAINLAFNHRNIPNSESQLKQQSYKDIERVGELLAAGVGLPSIGENEGKSNTI